MRAAIGFDELEGRARAVADAERLVERRWRALGRAGFVIERIAPAKAVQATAAFLEEGDDGVQIVERFDAVAGVVAAAAVGPARVALFGTRAEHDDVGAPLGAAGGTARNGEGEAGVVEHGGGLVGQSAVEWTLRAQVPDAAMPPSVTTRHLASQIALAEGDGAGEQGGDLGFGAAEALDVGRGDVDGDRRAAVRGVGRDAEAAVGAARERQDRLGAAFAGEAGAAACRAGTTSGSR